MRHFWVSGADAIKKAFAELEPKLARKVIRKAVRDGAKDMAKKIKAVAPKRTGLGRRRIRVRSSKGPRGTKKAIAMAVLTGEASGGKGQHGHGGETWYMWLQERGWKTGKRIRQGGKVVGRVGKVTKVRGKRFVKRTMRQNEARIQRDIREMILAGIETEVKPVNSP